jgi:hypothetical protein
MKCTKCGRSNFLTAHGLAKHASKCRAKTSETISGPQGHGFTVHDKYGGYDRYFVNSYGDRVVEHYDGEESYAEGVTDREWEAARKKAGRR